jgi:hypothetical protein
VNDLGVLSQDSDAVAGTGSSPRQQWFQHEIRKRPVLCQLLLDEQSSEHRLMAHVGL